MKGVLKTILKKRTQTDKNQMKEETLQPIPVGSFTELEQIILRFVWNHRQHQIAKALLRELERKEKAGSIICFLPSNYNSKLQSSK